MNQTYKFHAIRTYTQVSYISVYSYLLFLSSVGHSVSLFVSDLSSNDIREFNETTGAFVGTFGTTAADISIPYIANFHPTTGNLI